MPSRGISFRFVFATSDGPLPREYNVQKRDAYHSILLTAFSRVHPDFDGFLASHFSKLARLDASSLSTSSRGYGPSVLLERIIYELCACYDGIRSRDVPFKSETLLRNRTCPCLEHKGRE